MGIKVDESDHWALAPQLATTVQLKQRKTEHKAEEESEAALGLGLQVLWLCRDRNFRGKTPPCSILQFNLNLPPLS